MNPSYFRIKLPEDAAVKRLCEWNETDYKEKIETTLSEAVDVSIDDREMWKGSCVYVYEKDGWTVFEDLSGFFFSIPAESWLQFAQMDELVVAGYNDAILCAELIVINEGKVIKEFLEIEESPEENVNEGTFEWEINDWTDVAEFVDEDEIVFSETGTVYIF